MRTSMASIYRVSGLILMVLLALTALAQTNIAPNGTGYTWHTMSSQTGTNNQTAAPGVNDGNLTVGVNADVAGEPSQNQYEAGGVIFSTAQSGITQVDFINGQIDSYGNGYFEANMALQTYNGTSWSNVSGWALTPVYPYDSTAGGVTYTFTGAALNNVRGVRVVGMVRCSCLDNSWSWIVNEVQIYASASPDFSITASPASQTVTAGGGTSYTVTISSLNGFNGAVALSVSGLPSGASGIFNPSSVTGSGSSTLTVSTSGSTAAGTYPLTISGTSGSLSHTTTVTLMVNMAVSGDFTISANPSTQSITAGNAASYTATISSSGGFNGSVSLSAAGLPSGTNGTFNPSSVTGAGSSTLTITTSNTAKAGTYTLTLTGTSGSLSHSTSVTLMITSNSGNVLSWMGHSWNMTNGGSAGVLKASQNNISVDSNGYLHLKISKSSKGVFTGSEMFTQDNMGFGTFQWQIQGSNIYAMDPPVVLGLFPYGPANNIGVDGENELDIEFSNWNGAFNPTQVNADFTDYPSTGNRLSGGNSEWEDDFQVSAQTYTTARIQWSSNQVVWTLMSGLQPIGTTANVIKQDTFNGNTTTIPQDAIPVGINLWSYQVKPTHTWEIIIQNFQFVHQ